MKPGLLSTLLLLSAAAAAAEPREFLEAALEDYALGGRYLLPAIDDADVDALLAGEPLVFDLRETGSGSNSDTTTMAILGAKVFDTPRLLVWLTALGGNSDYQSAQRSGSETSERAAGRASKSRVVHAMLARDDDGSYVRYQHLNLPWPVKDRHWAIYCRKNPDVAVASDGRVWEHFWTLEADGREQASAALLDGRLVGLTAKALDKAIYLPANEGAWIMFDLGDNKTLVLAYMDVGLGGTFPRSLVRNFTRKQLKAGLNVMGELAARVHREYDEAPLIHDGYGVAISRADAVTVAKSWQDTLELETTSDTTGGVVGSN